MTDEWENKRVPIPEQIESDIGAIPDREYAPIVFSGDGTNVLMNFTANVITKLLSSLRNGALATYGDDGKDVYWQFLQQIDYPMEICQAMIECLVGDADVQNALGYLIETNERVRDALRDLIANDTEIQESINNYSYHGISEQQSAANILKDGECGEGYLFNQASVFIDLLNTIVIDLFEALEVGTNALERAALAVSAVPILSELPIDEGLTFADQLIENVQEEYSGAYDTAMYDDLRCGLWCMFKDDCTLSLDDAITFYREKAGSELPSNPLEAVLALASFLDHGDYPGDLAVYGMHLFALMLMKAGQEVMGVNFTRLYLRIVAAGDEFDNDYTTICEECPDETGCTEYILNEQGITVFTGQHTGVYVETGEIITFDVSGSISYNEYTLNVGPLGSEPSPGTGYVFPGPYLFSAIARIGSDGPWFYVGEHLEVTADRSGEILVLTNTWPAAVSAVNYIGTLLWEICISEPDVCVDLTATRDGWYEGNQFYTVDGAYGQWIDGEGLAPSSLGNGLTFFFFKQVALTVSRLRFTFNVPVANIRIGRTGVFVSNTSSVAKTVWEFDEATDPDIFPLDMTQNTWVSPVSNQMPSHDIRMTSACIFPA
jgi:hypothetical protein